MRKTLVDLGERDARIDDEEIGEENCPIDAMLAVQIIRS